MSAGSGDVVRGSIKVDNLPEGCCFTSFEELLKALPNWLTVEVPGDITNVVVSNQAPSEAQRDSVWFKIGTGSAFLGIFVFSTGAWRQVYPVPNQLIRVHGNSTLPPAGYEVLSTDYVSAAILAHQKNSWHVGGTISGVDWYDVYDVVWTGLF